MAATEPTHTEGSFSPAGEPGLKLWYQSWRPSAEPRAVVVIAHGLKDHSTRYTELARELAARRFAVYAADMRGHGRSGGERVWVRRFGEYVQDLDQFLQIVREKEPGKRVYLLGHSMGGVISTLYATEHPSDVAGVVLSAAALKPDRSVSRAAVAFTKFFSLVAPHAKLFRTENAQFSRDPKVVEAMDADPLIYQPPAPVRTAAELLGAMERVRRTSSNFRAPLLAMHGSGDRLTNLEGSSELVARVGSADRRLRVFPGLVHDLLHEPERATVNSEIFAWLDAHAPTR